MSSPALINNSTMVGVDLPCLRMSVPHALTRRGSMLQGEFKRSTGEPFDGLRADTPYGVRV
jgi:hypothetical protein